MDKTSPAVIRGSRLFNTYSAFLARERNHKIFSFNQKRLPSRWTLSPTASQLLAPFPFLIALIRIVVLIVVIIVLLLGGFFRNVFE